MKLEEAFEKAKELYKPGLEIQIRNFDVNVFFLDIDENTCKGGLTNGRFNYNDFWNNNWYISVINKRAEIYE